MSDVNFNKIEPYKHLTCSRPYITRGFCIGIDPYDINNIAFMHGAVITHGNSSFIVDCDVEDKNDINEIQLCGQLLVLVTAVNIVFVDCTIHKILHKSVAHTPFYTHTILTNKHLICTYYCREYQLFDDCNLRIDIDIFDTKTYSKITSIKNIDLKEEMWLYSFKIDPHNENLVKIITSMKVSPAKFKCFTVDLKDQTVTEFPAAYVVDANKFHVHDILIGQKTRLLSTIDNKFIAVIEYGLDGTVIEINKYELNVAEIRKHGSYTSDAARCIYSPSFNCLVNVCQLDSCSHIYYTDVTPYFSVSDKTSGLHTKAAPIKTACGFEIASNSDLTS